MGKLNKLFRAVGLLLRRPHLINLVLEDQEEMRKEVVKRFGFENGLPEIELTSLTQESQHELNTCSFLGGGSISTDYILLKILAAKFTPCSYFEIGTWRGESAVNVAEVAAEVVTMNLSAGQMRERKWDEQYIELHGFYSRGNGRIKHIDGDSLQFDFTPLRKKFDVIFIDGDHHFASVKSDTTNCFGLRRNERSIMVWHDYGSDTESIRWEVLRGILEGLPKEAHRHLYRVSNTLCAVYYPYPVVSAVPVYPKKPTANFKTTVNFPGKQP